MLCGKVLLLLLLLLVQYSYAVDALVVVESTEQKLVVHCLVHEVQVFSDDDVQVSSENLPVLPEPSDYVETATVLFAVATLVLHIFFIEYLFFLLLVFFLQILFF